MTTETSDQAVINKNPMEQDPQSENSDPPWKHRPDKDTLEHITPFAFHIDSTLIGQPLAKPRRRATALLIDLCLIAILGSAPLYVSLLFLIYMFFRYRHIKRLRAKSDSENKRFRYLRTLANITLLVFAVTCISVLINFVSNEDSVAYLDTTVISNDDITLSIGDNIRLNRYLGELDSNLDRAGCETVACYRQVLDDVPAFMDEVNVLPEDRDTVVDKVLAPIDIAPPQKQELREFLQRGYLETRSRSENSDDNPEGSNRADREIDPVFTWLLKQLEEFGLSFGWAAFYFSAMTAWFNGRTLGKRMLSIRVVKLDGKPLTLWESFGRYGGYGAGLATGLLGFLQIYWDPNRQAIQDKIAGTAVCVDFS